MKALIVDDSRTVRLILSKMLKALGFETIETENGKVALDALASAGPFDLALIDWNMPVMNGLETVKALRADDRFKQLPIMIITTELEHDQVILALNTRATQCLMKPFSIEAVSEKLALLGLTG